MKYGAPVREPAQPKPKTDLSDEQRKELLEKLKERRRRSLGDQDGGTEEK